MKNKFNILLAIFIIFSYWACDKIEGPYTESIGEITQTGDTIKSIILFEHTAHKCINCPNGHDSIASIINTFGKNFHSIGIHAGSLASTDDMFATNFVVNEGEELYNHYGNPAQPAGAVNSLLGDDLLPETAWINDVVSWYNKETEIYLTVEEEISTSKLEINIKGEFISDIIGETYLCVYVTEDSIVSPQVSVSGVQQEYIHNHVFRGSINGTWGELLELNPANGMKFEKSYEINVDGIYLQNANQLHMIPFVYNKDTYKLLSTSIIKLKDEHK